jgi:hypothetical protein
MAAMQQQQPQQQQRIALDKKIYNPGGKHTARGARVGRMQAKTPTEYLLKITKQHPVARIKWIEGTQGLTQAGCSKRRLT